MESVFQVFLKEGFWHICDLSAYDHLLFVLALGVAYSYRSWRQIVLLATAFTIGHSVTLALTVYDKISVPMEWIEFLIPATILVTALSNLWTTDDPQSNAKTLPRYILTLFFGLIHGMGFSTYLRALVGDGSSIVQELLGFNIGLELGQLLIISGLLILNFIYLSINAPQKYWRITLSICIAIASSILLVDAKFW